LKEREKTGSFPINRVKATRGGKKEKGKKKSMGGGSSYPNTFRKKKLIMREKKGERPFFSGTVRRTEIMEDPWGKKKTGELDVERKVNFRGMPPGLLSRKGT